MRKKQTEEMDELHIEHPELEARMCADLKHYGILYLYAPIGWEKERIVGDFAAHHPEYPSRVVTDLDRLPESGGELLLVPCLEKLMGRPDIGKLWERISERRKGERWILTASVPLPEELMPFRVAGRLRIYGSGDLRPENRDVRAYLEKKGFRLYEEDYLHIEKDFDNMPLCVYMLEDPLRNSIHGYGRQEKEQCLEDVFFWIDIRFFRSLKTEEQNALLSLACFEELTEELVGTILDIPAEEARTLVKRFRNKGSILEECGGGRWRFAGLFRQFLARMEGKYMASEQLHQLYRRAMVYYEGKEEYGAALRFAELLKLNDRVAEFLDRILARPISYETFLSLEEYCLSLPMTWRKEYPRLIMAGAMLECIAGNREGYEEYVKLLERREAKETGEMLLILKMLGTGSMTPELLSEIWKHTEEIGVSTGKIWSMLQIPGNISLLHGDKDYSAFFVWQGRKKKNPYLEQIERLAGEDYASMAEFLLAEVCYERNELDEALTRLSRAFRMAVQEKNVRMQKLCNLKVADLMVIRNQADGAEAFLLHRLEEPEATDCYWNGNLLAHRMQYHLLKNDEERILGWMKKEAPDERGRFLSVEYYQYLMKARVYLWQEQYVQAEMILLTLKDFADSSGMTYLGIQVRILEAIQSYREQRESWRELLSEAVEMGRRYWFIRVFADEGEAVHELLNLLYGEKERKEDLYIKELLSAARAQMLIYPGYLKRKKPLQVESFTQYEKDVVKLLALGEKNAENARALCVSENTVKYHLKNIYQKLGAKNRSQALNLIAEYHLL